MHDLELLLHSWNVIFPKAGVSRQERALCTHGWRQTAAITSANAKLSNPVQLGSAGAGRKRQPQEEGRTEGLPPRAGTSLSLPVLHRKRGNHASECPKSITKWSHLTWLFTLGSLPLVVGQNHLAGLLGIRSPAPRSDGPSQILQPKFRPSIGPYSDNSRAWQHEGVRCVPYAY